MEMEQEKKQKVWISGSTPNDNNIQFAVLQQDNKIEYRNGENTVTKTDK